MSGDRNNQQPSIPEPARLGVEHLWLAVAVVAFTTAVVALFVEDRTTVQVLRGGYSVLTGLFVSGCVGWTVGAAHRELRREYMRDRRALAQRLEAMAANQVAVLAALDQIRSELAARRTVDRPGIHTPNRWVGRHVAAAVGNEIRTVATASVDGDTVPLPPIPPETQALLRRINLRLCKGGTDK